MYEIREKAREYRRNVYREIGGGSDNKGYGSQSQTQLYNSVQQQQNSTLNYSPSSTSSYHQNLQ